MYHAYDKDVTELNNFIDNLPPNLKGKVAWYIHEETWNNFSIFKSQGLISNHEFLAWLANLLRPCLMAEETEIYQETDQVREIFFLQNGECFFCLSAKM